MATRRLGLINLSGKEQTVVDIITVGQKAPGFTIKKTDRLLGRALQETCGRVRVVAVVI